MKERLAAVQDKQAATNSSLVKGDKPNKFIYATTPIVCILYLHFTYDKFFDFASFRLLALKFTLFAFSIGIIISILPLNRPVRFTFLSTVAVPLLCYLLELALTVMIFNPAHAGRGGVGPSTTDIMYLNLILMTIGGVVFGSLAVVGCLVGCEVKKFVTRIAAQSLTKSSNDGLKEETEILAAKIGARTTLIAGVISALSSILIELLK